MEIEFPVSQKTKNPKQFRLENRHLWFCHFSQFAVYCHNKWEWYRSDRLQRWELKCLSLSECRTKNRSSHREINTHKHRFLPDSMLFFVLRFLSISLSHSAIIDQFSELSRKNNFCPKRLFARCIYQDYMCLGTHLSIFTIHARARASFALIQNASRAFDWSNAWYRRLWSESCRC